MEDRGIYFIKNIEFAKKSADEYLESAIFFKHKGNEKAYEYCFGNCQEWLKIHEMWVDLARNEQCYIVD